MNKHSLSVRSLAAAFSAKRSLPALLAAGLLMGSFAQRAQAQTPATPATPTPTLAEETTHNLQDRITLIKATAAGTVTFTLAPEDPTKVTREHWPIVFIDYENDGQNIRQMYNLTEDRTFTVNVSATQGGVIKITGEEGMWKLVSASQKIKDADFTKVPSIRYIDLHDNVLGSANAQAKYTFDNVLTNVETLNLATNQLKDIDFGRTDETIRELNVSENLLANFPSTSFTKLQKADLSKNLLTDIGYSANDRRFGDDKSFKEATWTVYKGGDATAFNQALGGNNANIYASRAKATDAELNLTVNKLNILTLPTKPENVTDEHYYFTLQERYVVPQSPRGDDTWRPLETMTLSSQSYARGLASSFKTTKYELWREINPGTDEYIRVPDNEFSVDQHGNLTFRRAYGPGTRLFVAMTNEGFNTGGGRPLESFERGTGTITTDGFDQVLKQPEGTPSADRSTYFATVSTTGANDIGDGDTRALPKRFFRTNTFTLDGSKNNYWYGYVSTDWANKENWTGRFVPNTLAANYADNEQSDVVFASVNDNTPDPVTGVAAEKYGESAIRDLYADQDRVVRNYINATETGRAMVATPGNQILLKEKALLWDLTTSTAAATEPFATRGVADYTVVQAEEGKPNGTFLLAKPADNANYKANVEMFAKSFDGNRNKAYATWQYFGSPVKSADRNQLPLETTWVRKYDRTLNVPNSDEKWTDVNNGTLAQGQAYEISQPKPATYRFIGELNTADFTFPVDGMASATNYQDMNILANPYTGAMSIDKLDFSGATAADKVVYLFNTGSRKDWIANSGPTTNGTTQGQYTKAIPANLAGHVAGMPNQIPSLSSFMVKSTAAGNLKYRYADLVTATEENRAPQRHFHSLAVDVESAKTADRLWLVQAEGTTDRYDNGWDGEKIFAPGEAALYAMQDRSYQVTTTDAIGETKVGFVPGDGEQNYKLTFHLDGGDGTQQYTLLDKRTGLTRAIHDGDTYEFTATKGDAAHRFTILGNGAKATVDQRGFQITADLRRNFTVKNFTDQPAEALVFDAAGKIQARFTVEPGSENTGTVVMPGAYVVRVSNKVTTLTQRFVMP